MNRRIRGAVICLAVLGLAIGIAACTNLLTAPVGPTLLTGSVMITGDRGEILLSVKNMPDGGLASLAVVLGGITYPVAKVENVAVVPLAGFTVLAEQFAAGSGGFLVAHSCAGLPEGEFAKLTFDVIGASPVLAEFTFKEADISMGDDSNNAIVFGISDPLEFYSK